MVYVGSWDPDNKLYAFNAGTGAPLPGWPLTITFPNFVGREVITTNPVVANGVVYVGTVNGHVYAFNATTGALLPGWPVGYPQGPAQSVYSDPAVANGVAYVGANDHKFYAFNATTGALLWSASTGGAITSSPAVAAGTVYVGSGDGKLYAYTILGLSGAGPLNR